MIKKIFLFILIVFLAQYIKAQDSKKISIINADVAISVEKGNYTRMIDNVVFQHDKAFLYCDSAYFYGSKNSLEAFGKVHLKMNDTLNLYCKKLLYLGDKKIAYARNEVVLKDNTMTLYTDSLDYYRTENYAYYPKDGKIIDTTNQLTSVTGFYYPDLNEFHFQKNVVLQNKEYILLSDTLLYNTENHIATILGPTEIVGENRYSYCEQGWYNTENNDSRLYKNVCVTEENKIAHCDSIFYDSKTEISQAFGSISAMDTVEHFSIFGNYAEFHQKEGFGFVVDSAVAIYFDKKDSLFLHADTLFIRLDTADKIQQVIAYYHMKFFRKDFQGACDSMIYSAIDSTLKMYYNPVLWSGETMQISSDSVYLLIKNEKLDSVFFFNNGFIISIDTLENYNQIKSTTIIGNFKDNEIQKVTALGNAESVYYIRDDDKKLIGIDKAASSYLYITIIDNQLESVTYINDAKATTYPEKDFPIEYKKMRGFNLQKERRPTNKDDIFIKN